MELIKTSFLILLTIYLIILTYLSVIPSQESVYLVSINDKAKHVFAYLTLSLLLLINFKLHKINNYFLVVLLAGGYGVFMEILQYFIPSRFFSLTDIIANVFGASITLIAKVINRRKSK